MHRNAVLSSDIRAETGQRIRALLYLGEKSFSQIARESGIAAAELSAISRGNKDITRDQLCSLLAVLNVTKQEFLRDLNLPAQCALNNLFSNVLPCESHDTKIRMSGAAENSQSSSTAHQLESIRDQEGCLPESPALPEKQSGKLKHSFTDKVLDALDMLGGGATAEAISIIIRADRANVSRCLSRLTSAGFLLQESEQLRPGIDRGRPIMLYFRPHINSENDNIRMTYLLLSGVIKIGALDGYRLHFFQVQEQFVVLQSPENSNEPTLVFILDNGCDDADQLAQRVKRAKDFTAGRQAVVAIIGADSDRIEAFKTLPHPLPVANIARLLSPQSWEKT
jgi:transcriptional regulator with XRE-family HTH domain